MAEGFFQNTISGWGLTQACSLKQLGDLGGSELDFTPDLDDVEDFQLSEAENSDRCGQPISDEALDEAIVKRVPYKTRKTTKWVVSVFRSWFVARGIAKDITELGADQFANLLPRFVMEARRQDKTPYPPRMLVMLVAGIQRHLRESGVPDLCVLGDKDARFARTRGALDARMNQLTQDGVATSHKQALPLTREQEDELWSRGIFSLASGWGLQSFGTTASCLVCVGRMNTGI